MSTLRAALAGLVLAAYASPAAAVRLDFESGPPDLVKFESKAIVESFEGKTDRVSGTVELDPSDLGSTLDLVVRVDLASLETGIGLRDRNMRENHLHTDEFPTATFRAGRIVEGADGDLTAGTPTPVVVEGTLDLHGVVRTREIPLELTWNAAESTLRVVARFPVALADHEIPRPGFLVVRLGEVQQVSVDLGAGPPPDPDEAP